MKKRKHDTCLSNLAKMRELMVKECKNHSRQTLHAGLEFVDSLISEDQLDMFHIQPSHQSSDD
jgi:hypothetical protein